MATYAGAARRAGAGASKPLRLERVHPLLEACGVARRTQARSDSGSLTTLPGFPSLELANALAGEERVLISSPNWRTAVEPR